MIKRPVIVYPDGSLTLGFVPEKIVEKLWIRLIKIEDF